MNFLCISFAARSKSLFRICVRDLYFGLFSRLSKYRRQRLLFSSTLVLSMKSLFGRIRGLIWLLLGIVLLIHEHFLGLIVPIRLSCRNYPDCRFQKWRICRIFLYKKSAWLLWMLPVLPGLDMIYSIPYLKFDLCLLVNSDCFWCELNSNCHIVGICKFSLDVFG